MADAKTTVDNAPAPAAAPANQSSLRPSLLAAKADAMWNASKKQFETSGKMISMGSIKLNTKTFSEISANNDKIKEQKIDDTPKPKFIFGQNVSSRVMKGSSSFKPIDENSDDTNKTDISASQNSSKEEKGMVAKSFDEFKKEAEEVAARHKDELEKSMPTTSVIDVKTGEEEDHVAFQSGCKIHVFDKQNKKWAEKGLAVLKISKRTDEDGEHHRILARTTGIHKLVINSKIFPDMTVERVDQKRLKISAMNADEPPTLQIFLINFGFTNSDLNIENALTMLKSLVEKSKAELKNRKRRMSEDDKVEEVCTKIEKSEVDDSPEDVDSNSS